MEENPYQAPTVDEPQEAKKPSRQFGLVDLLVVMVIVGLVVAALLPAVGAARYAPRSTYIQWPQW